MFLTKEPPFSLHKLTCATNAVIEVLKFNVELLPYKNISLGSINHTLSAIGNGYQSSYSLGQQWIQLMDMIDRICTDEITKNEIEKMALELHDRFFK